MKIFRLFCYCLISALLCSQALPAIFAQSKVNPYPGYENLERNYRPGKPLLGPGSDLDNALTDRAHKVVKATRPLPPVAEWLERDAAKYTDGKSQIIDLLVMTKPAVLGHFQISNKFVERVKDGLSVYPRSLLCVLLNCHCKIRMGHLLSDVEPSLIGVHPSGYSSDSSFDNAGAVFFRRSSILITEYKLRRDREIAEPDVEHAIQHEVGHAIDCYYGELSASQIFLQCYESDRKEITPALRQTRTYFLQEEKRGPEEVFAELLACKYGDPTGKRIQHVPELFPRCKELVDQHFPFEFVLGRFAPLKARR